MGSGGHTGEMMLLLEKLSDNYHPRCYVVGHDDHRSRFKVHEYEKRRDGIFEKDYFVYEIHRARKVGQSIPSSILSTLRSAIDAFIWIMYMIRSPPELILCNGPAICVPIAFAGYFSKIFYGLWTKYPTRIVYIESFARVESLSITGKILYWIADGFIIQWPTTCKGLASDPLSKSIYFNSPII